MVLSYFLIKLFTFFSVSSVETLSTTIISIFLYELSSRVIMVVMSPSPSFQVGTRTDTFGSYTLLVNDIPFDLYFFKETKTSCHGLTNI